MICWIFDAKKKKEFSISTIDNNNEYLLIDFKHVNSGININFKYFYDVKVRNTIKINDNEYSVTSDSAL